MKAKKFSARQVPAQVSAEISSMRRQRGSPHKLLFQAAAIVECMRITTLYGDFHNTPYLLLTDAAEAAKDLIHDALEGMGDDDPPAE